MPMVYNLKNKLCLCLLFILLGFDFLFLPSADAGSRRIPSADIISSMQKYQYMPEYCQCKMAETEMRMKYGMVYNKINSIPWPSGFAKMLGKYLRIFGDSWSHMHHFCFGIRKINQALKITDARFKNQKESTLRSALAEFIYVENSQKTKFPLWPQLYQYKAQLYNLLGQPAEANYALRKAARYQENRKK